MSEGEAYRRIVAARLARKFPVIPALVASGKVHLSALALLKSHLTPDNHAELLDLICGKTKREVQTLVAHLAPRPDVPSRMRKLPPRRPPSLSTCDTSARGAAQIQVLAPERHAVHFTASTELRGKLERALDLTSHVNPSRDLALVVERAVDLLLNDLERKKLGKAARPARPRRSDGEHVSNPTRREVFARDGERCTYTSSHGERCTARAFLELDHKQPRALGGSADPDNLRVLCRAHNLLAAEAVFGRDLISRPIHLRELRKPYSPCTRRARRPATGRASARIQHEDGNPLALGEAAACRASRKPLAQGTASPHHASAKPKCSGTPEKTGWGRRPFALGTPLRTHAPAAAACLWDRCTLLAE
ncbi:MAG: HNH endonuclease [Myxococcales bacterium]|nr:HNH endonuclease [Myxococcales bacterium]